MMKIIQKNLDFNTVHSEGVRDRRILLIVNNDVEISHCVRNDSLCHSKGIHDR